MVRFKSVREAKRLTGEILRDLDKIAIMVQNSTSRKEADALFSVLSETDVVDADAIWDYWIDWQKVKWKDVV